MTFSCNNWFFIKIFLQNRLTEVIFKMDNPPDLYASSKGWRIRNFRIESKLLLIAILLFCGLFIYGIYFSDEKGNIKGDLFVPILVSVTFLIIILGVLKGLNDCRWKK